LIFGRKLNKLTEENQKDLLSSQINIKNNALDSPRPAGVDEQRKKE